MKYFGVILLVFLVSISVLVSGKGRLRPGRGKDGNKGGRVPRNSVKAVTTCMGQPFDWTSQLESSAVQECLDTRIQEFQEQTEANDNKDGKGHGKWNAKRKEKKKERLAKKLTKKCTPECELQTLNLIPDINVTESSFPIPDKFINMFPQEVQDTLKNKMQACYNNTKPLVPKEEKKGPRQKMCFTNMRLVKCLGRSVRQTCNGKGGIFSANGTAGGVSPISNNNGSMSTTPTSNNANNDDDDEDALDDDKDDDDDNDDEESTTTTGSGITATTKGSIPDTSIDTSKPITK